MDTAAGSNKMLKSSNKLDGSSMASIDLDVNEEDIVNNVFLMIGEVISDKSLNKVGVINILK